MKKQGQRSQVTYLRTELVLVQGYIFHPSWRVLSNTLIQGSNFISKWNKIILKIVIIKASWQVS